MTARAGSEVLRIAHIAKGPVTRYELRQDMPGKSLSTLILTIEPPDTD